MERLSLRHTDNAAVLIREARVPAILVLGTDCHEEQMLRLTGFMDAAVPHVAVGCDTPTGAPSMPKVNSNDRGTAGETLESQRTEQSRTAERLKSHQSKWAV